MKKVILLFVAVCLVAGVSMTAEPTTSTWGGEGTQPTPTPTVEVVAEPVLKAMKIRDGLTRRQRRDIGLTYVNIRRTMATMQASGEIDETMTKAEMSLAVMDKLLSDNPSAFGDTTPEGWDEILAWIERILPIILKLIALFSYDMGVVPVDMDMGPAQIPFDTSMAA